MAETTPRLGLPMIVPGQAQKEMTHNEALARIDAVVQPAAVSLGETVPPGDPEDGGCWIVGAAPLGAWAGQAGRLAMWTAGGWRFVAPVPGLRVWLLDRGVDARWIDGAWVAGRVHVTPADSIPSPAGGTTVDLESRTAIGAILAALRGHGLVQTA